MVKIKLQDCIKIIRKLESVAVAFSGGVDSALLSKISYDELGQSAIAITLCGPMTPSSEIEDSKKIARLIGIKHIFISTDTIENQIADNPIDRCYYCKKTEFSIIKKKAAELGVKYVLDGSNRDDLSDYRPGLNALNELGIISPLRLAGLTKADIRELSKQFALPIWNKPAAACLASRIPYGEPITVDKLKKIEFAEDYLRKLGFLQFRVRCHQQNIARIEIAAEEINSMLDVLKMKQVSEHLKSLGFLYVCMELEGYQSGSLNKVINPNI